MNDNLGKYSIFIDTVLLYLNKFKMKNLSIVECYSIHKGAVSNVHSDEESFWPSHKLWLNQLPPFSKIHC
jgi:hypothetical protein